MPDKLTDKEIVKALNNCQYGYKSCDECPLCNDPCEIDHGGVPIFIVNLINRLQVENENYSKNNQQMTSDILKLYKELEQAKAENERLSQFGGILLRSGSELFKEIKTAKAEAYKEFGELFKSKLNNPYIQKQGIDIVNFLKGMVDDTAKELVGEK